MPDQDGDPKTEIDRALEQLLVGDARVTVDPATGEIRIATEGEKSSLTDSQDPPTIP